MKRAYSDREGDRSAGRRRHSDENEPLPQLHTIFYGEVKAPNSDTDSHFDMNFTIHNYIRHNTY